MTHRIISLLPGATEIVAALGAVEQLVGISHECDYPVEVRDRARVTASAVDPHAASAAIDDEVRRLASAGTPVFAIDATQLRALAPSHILTQSLCEVCAVGEGDVHSVVGLLDSMPAVIPMTGTTLAGVWDDVRRIGAALHRQQAADALLASLDARLLVVHETLKAARAPRRRVAVIEWLDPLFAAGHWTPELVRRGGGIDVLAEPGAHSVTIGVEQVRAAEPDLLLFAPCGFDVGRSARDASALLATEAWRWAAGIEAWALDGNALTSRPGPRLADAVEVIASIVAPGLFAAPSERYAIRLA